MSGGTDWTVMLYMAGDNTALDKSVNTDMRKLKSAMVEGGGSNRVRVLTQYDRKGTQKGRRFEITSDGTASDYPADLVEEVAELNTGDPVQLTKFVKWAIQRAPARHYAVVLWGHGYGVDDETVFEESGIRPVARRLVRPPIFKSPLEAELREMENARSVDKMFRDSNIAGFFPDAGEFEELIRDFNDFTSIGTDETNHDFLSNVEMKKAFEQVRFDDQLGLTKNLDIVVMDACNMSMAEVAYQLRNSVEIMVASEEATPLKGWPYDILLGQLMAQPNMSPIDLSKLMVKEYISYYHGVDEDVTQAASKLGACANLRDVVDKLASELLDSLLSPTFLDDLRISRYHAQQYYVEGSFVDLYDFCRLLSKRTKINSVINVCEEVTDAIANNFIISSDCKGSTVRFSRGVSIYFPVGSRLKLYRQLDFVKETRWIKFLDSFLAKTERVD